MTVRPAAASFREAAARPRVLHVVRQFWPNRGGLEDVVRHLCAEQIRAGIDARVLTLDRLFRDPGTVLPAIDAVDGIPVARIPFRGSTRYPLAPGFLPHLAGADLVHVHAVDSFFDALALTRPLHRKPLVATTHGGFFHTRAFSGLKGLWFRGPTRLSCRAYGAIVGCSDSDASTFARVAPGKVCTILNGVDLAKFAGASSPVPVRRIVTLGRFSDNKRLDRLLAAMAALRARDPGWHLDVVGVESDWSAERLRGAVGAAGLSGAVEVRVGLDDGAVARVMQGATFFASASDYEGFGLALIEALSAGLVPLVQPNAAFAAVAADHAEVELVDFGDAPAAAAAFEGAFRRLAAAPGGRRPPDLSRYAWPEVAARYAAVYAACRPGFAPRTA
ncbi:glycosyltransferase family 4 protein [Lichenibacterium dinghuense]|uniref:glycosyltransferase family 4 protein n=1 Tax=Lichenibacterium dinghuense TaxID=2895977 RepID=UPI001F275102|nr:glycosyltransferase family 4 protein [Lichenibacterium sp. 6Y81]